jgi:hypothetical protein
MNKIEAYKLESDFLDFAFCEICDNLTPIVPIEIVDEGTVFGCEVCFDAYGVELMEF